VKNTTNHQFRVEVPHDDYKRYTWQISPGKAKEGSYDHAVSVFIEVLYIHGAQVQRAYVTYTIVQHPYSKKYTIETHEGWQG